MPRPAKLDPALLEAALLGLEQKRQRLDEHIAQIRRLMDGKGTPATGAPKKRRLRAAAIERIRAAQRRRWAAYRKAQGK